MQLSILEILDDVDYSGKNVMIGLSGGINSACALIYLAKHVKQKPKKLFLYYAHFEEHSDGTEKFVHDLVDYAKIHFDDVSYTQTNNSLFRFFEKMNMIPQPKVAVCTRLLKVEPIVEFMRDNQIDLDIVGYVRHEFNRINRQIQRGLNNKDYLIRHLTDEDCFALVKSELGYYPEIYNIKWNDERILPYANLNRHLIKENQYNIICTYANQGYNFRRKSYRVFKHNNCLPCKNWHPWELMLMGLFYPDRYKEAIKLQDKIGSYWGRKDENLDADIDCLICTI